MEEPTGLIKLYGIIILVIGAISIIFLPITRWFVGKINHAKFKDNLIVSGIISLLTALLILYSIFCWEVSTFFICSVPPEFCHYPTFYDNLMKFIPSFLFGLISYLVIVGIIIFILIFKKSKNSKPRK